MPRPLSTIVLFSAVAMTGACASAPPTCVSGDGYLCGDDLDGFPFVRGAVMVSDTCPTPSLGDATQPPCAGVVPPAGGTNVSLRHPEPGKLCLSGTIRSDGFALFSLELALANPARTKILEPFDAAGRGITQVGLTVDSPPVQGVALLAHMITYRDCPTDALDCFYPPNFKARDINASGPMIVPLSDFKADDDPSVSIDTRVLNDLFFVAGVPGAYDFCIRDFNFLDAAGNKVLP